MDQEADDGSVFLMLNGVRKQIKPGELVRPLTAAEFPNVGVARYGVANPHQSFTMKSRHKITSDEVKTALWYETRQYVELQFCVQYHRCRYWFKRMEKLEIDFQFTSRPYDDVYYEASSAKFDVFKGPLWYVRMLQNETEDGFHETTLVIPIQHMITDGFSVFKMFQDISEFLNQICKKQEVFPKLRSIAPSITEYDEYKLAMDGKLKMFWTFFKRAAFRDLNSAVTFKGIFKTPKNRNGKYINYTICLLEEETTSLIKMSKQNGVTVNSTILTIINCALLTFVQSKSNKKFGYKRIYTMINVNLRQYYSEKFQETYGEHVTALLSENLVTSENLGDFWSLAKNYHRKIKQQIYEQKEHLSSFSLGYFYSLIINVNRLMKKLKLSPRYSVHYGLTNMGNIDKILPYNAEDPIQIVGFKRSNNPIYQGGLFIFGCETFRGKLQIDFSFHTSEFKEDDGKSVLDQCIKYLKNIVEFNELDGDGNNN